VIHIEEREESQGLFYRQIEGDARLMYKGEAGLLQADLITPDDGIPKLIPLSECAAGWEAWELPNPSVKSEKVYACNV
jgi:hypothetical protein